MFDIHIQTAEAVTISTPPAGRRYAPPRIIMTSQHFRQGFAKGFQAALMGETRDEPITDETIVDSIRTMFEDGTPEPTELELAIGNLIGEVLARS
jgi:hypothetical protein